MKKTLLLTGLVLLSVFPATMLSAASRSAEFTPNLEENISTKNSERQLRKAKKWQKRLDRFERKLKKRMERLHRKGIFEANLNLGTIGLIVLVLGGGFIALGLVTGPVGILFYIIGGLIALVGLILLLLLSGINVSTSDTN